MGIVSGDAIDLKVGDKVYNWRYGPLTITEIADKYIDVSIDDPKGIIEIEGDPWNRYLYEDHKERYLMKVFQSTSVGKWLFFKPNEVGKSRVIHGDETVVSDNEFEKKLHNFYKEEYKKPIEALKKEKSKLEADLKQKSHV